jgi:preprotein translocase subunit SecA
MSYPIVRKGMVITPQYTGYGASVERYQKRFSRKSEQKLQRKLARFKKRLAKLENRTWGIGKNIRARRIDRLQKKIQAIEMVLGMQPFDASLQAEAMAIANNEVKSSPMPLILGIAGALVIGGMVFYFVQKKGKK